MINLQTRELILKWTKENKTQQEIANLSGCNQSAVSRLLEKYRKTGSIKNIARSGRPTPLNKKTLTKRQMLADTTGATPAGLLALGARSARVVV